MLVIIIFVFLKDSFVILLSIYFLSKLIDYYASLSISNNNSLIFGNNLVYFTFIP